MGTIHFIWLGENPLPEDSRARLRKWKDLNSEAKLWLWVDKKTLSAEVEAIYGAQFPDIELVDISRLAEKIGTYPLPDQVQLKTLFEIALYENNRLKPNYGAASDILRYLILYLFAGSEEAGWGAYFDHDVATDSQSIESFLAAAPKTESLFFSRNSQRSDLSSNDALICIQQYHLFFKAVLEKVVENYTSVITFNPKARPCVYEYVKDDDEEERPGQRAVKPTVFRTGPQVFIEALGEFYDLGKLTHWNEENFERDIADERYEAFRPPEANAIPLAVCPGSVGKNAWLHIQVRSPISVADVFNQALKSIELETSCFGILRLDDHVKDIVDALAEGIKRSGAVSIAALESYVQAEGLVGTAGASGGAAATPESMELSSLAFSELVVRYHRIKSTGYGKPTELEEAVAKQLIQILEAKKPDLTQIKECQFVSRYKIIRDYYDVQLPLLEEASVLLDVAYKKISLILNCTDEMLLEIREIQAIADYWLQRVKADRRSYYANVLRILITSKVSSVLSSVGNLAGGAGRLSPADASHFIHPVASSTAQTAANSKIEAAKKPRNEQDDEEGGESKGKIKICDIM